MMDGIRNDPQYRPILKIANLCQSLGENNIKVLTITDKVELALNYYEMLQLHMKKEFRDRQMVRAEREKMKP